MSKISIDKYKKYAIGFYDLNKNKIQEIKSDNPSKLIIPKQNDIIEITVVEEDGGKEKHFEVCYIIYNLDEFESSNDKEIARIYVKEEDLDFLLTN